MRIFPVPNCENGMTAKYGKGLRIFRSSGGFTLMELIVVGIILSFFFL